MYKATGDFVRNRTFTQNPRKKMGYQGIARLLTKSGAATAGTLIYRNLHFPAALGKGGLRALKKEGDGATPLGIWALVRVYYRPDRVRRPSTALPVEPLSETHGWCDAPSNRNYNCRVIMPYEASAERLWRDDHLYDVIAVLDYNIRPRVQKRGSAIFLHIARPSFKPTDGCIAMRPEHLIRFLRAATPGTAISAGPHLIRINANAAGSSRGRFPVFRGRVLWRQSSPHGSAGPHGGGRPR